jgi:hypothetical protein
MLASENLSRDEHRIAKHNKVLELLADPEIEDMTVIQLRRLRELNLPVTYKFDYPQHVDVVHTETGEVERLLTFVDKPWADDVLVAVHYILWGLRIMGRSLHLIPRLVCVDYGIFTRTPGEDKPWDDELVAHLGRGPLAQEVYEATRAKWRIKDGS